MSSPDLNLAAFLPELLLGAAALVALLSGALSREARFVGPLSSVLLLAAIVAWWQADPAAVSFGGQYGGDGTAYFARGLFLVTALVLTFLAAGGRALVKARHAEFLSLLYISALGMMVMSAAQNFAIIFLGLETMSIPLYVMAAYERTDSASIEAGVKYFLYGAFASAFFVYGMALLFLSAGTLDIPRVYAAAHAPVAITGLLLILVGLAFKVAAVPFHMWAPDAYSGAPTLVTAFFAIAPKAAGFLALVRWVATANHVAGSEGTVALCSALAFLTILGGNLGALVQSRLKRMLAYSSVAHAGYLLLALVAPDSGGTQALLFYLVAYAVMTLGAFVVLLVYERDGGAATYDEISGRGYQRPALSLCMTVFMVSLAGLPGTIGFIGKLQIFKSAVLSGHVILVIVAVTGTLVSVAYYLRVVVYLYMRGESDRALTASPRVWAVAALLLAAGTVILGVFPEILWPALASLGSAGSVDSTWAGP